MKQWSKRAGALMGLMGCVFITAFVAGGASDALGHTQDQPKNGSNQTDIRARLATLE